MLWREFGLPSAVAFELHHGQARAHQIGCLSISGLGLLLAGDLAVVEVAGDLSEDEGDQGGCRHHSDGQQGFESGGIQGAGAGIWLKEEKKKGSVGNGSIIVAETGLSGVLEEAFERYRHVSEQLSPIEPKLNVPGSTGY